MGIKVFVGSIPTIPTRIRMGEAVKKTTQNKNRGDTPESKERFYMKAVVAGQALAIKTDIGFEDLSVAEKYDGKALTLYAEEDGKQIPVFKVATTGGPGEIGKFGAAFAQGADGKAVITVMLPDVDDPKEYIADTYGEILENLKVIEDALPAAVEEIKAKRAAIMDGIEVL